MPVNITAQRQSKEELAPRRGWKIKANFLTSGWGQPVWVLPPLIWERKKQEEGGGAEPPRFYVWLCSLACFLGCDPENCFALCLCISSLLVQALGNFFPYVSSPPIAASHVLPRAVWRLSALGERMSSWPMETSVAITFLLPWKLRLEQTCSLVRGGLRHHDRYR